MTGKAEFRNRGKVNSLHNDNLESESSNYHIKREKVGTLMQPDTTSNLHNNRKTIKSKLNKTSKLGRKSTTNGQNYDESGMSSNGFGMVQNDKQNMFNGHNYTVSINFNRPQQSKGKRPSVNQKGSRPQKESNKKNGWMKNNNVFRSSGAFDSPHGKPSQRADNIYDYDIETNKAGFIDIESSTRKRPSRTAHGKKRIGVSLLLTYL